MKQYFLMVGVLVVVGCATDVGSTSGNVSGTPCPEMIPPTYTVQPPLPEWASVKGAVGVVRAECAEIILDKGTAEGIGTSQAFLLCVLQGKRVVRLAPAAVRAVGEQTSTLRLDLKNVPDEDGDLIVVEGGRAVNEFRADPAKYIVEHEVFAVAIKTKSVESKGLLK